MIKLKSIIRKLEKKYPQNLKEEWDNVGLILGDSNQEVEKIQISLDVTEEVIENAIKNKTNLIITHHPMIFGSLKKINNQTILGKKILKLLKKNISVYTLHTNLDSAKEGLNDYIVKKLGVQKSEILDAEYEDLKKILISIPLECFEEIKLKILKLNDFGNEKYKDTSYTLEGEETFLALDDSNPKKGEKNILEKVKTKRLEILTQEFKVKQILNEIRKIHPYEEMMYEIVKVENKEIKSGIGRIFELPKKVDLSEYIQEIKSKLEIKNIKAVYNEDKKIQKIGIVNGSGASYIKRMKRAGVDLFITSDIKYHEALDSLETGLALVDLGHYESEVFFSDLIKKELPANIEVEVFNSKPVFKFL